MVLALNKPYGVLSQFNQNPDYPEQKTLADIGVPHEFLPVGRLDMDSEGLLLLSDDKGFENALLNPKFEHRRTYWVQVDGTPADADLQQWRDGGLQIRKHLTKPCKVQLLEENPGFPEREVPLDPAQATRSSWLEMELTEGKNRQVRRMTAKLGFPTLRLIRIRIGAFQLENSLEPGSWYELTPKEVQALRS